MGSIGLRDEGKGSTFGFPNILHLMPGGWVNYVPFSRYISALYLFAHYNSTASMDFMGE